ncbi:MAG: phospholipase [Phycisphaeraceae bacterium]|nr:MAG: phospholipase [Phycisphaeraceae bacterium]
MFAEMCVLAMTGVGSMVGVTENEPALAASPGFHFVEVEGVGGPVKGAIYIPWSMPDDEGGAPALVFLHGYGECGTEGTHQLGVGLPNVLIWNPERWPFVVVIPQKPEFNADWDDYEDAVLAMLDLAIADYGVDADRVALTGLSQGGHGTIALASHHPDRFRAAAPVCGYTAQRFVDGDRRELPPVTAESPAVVAAAEALAGTPVWIFHGGADDVVPPAESESLHAALVAAGNDDAKLTIFPNANHNAWDPAYRGDHALWSWLFEQTEAE